MLAPDPATCSEDGAMTETSALASSLDGQAPRGTRASSPPTCAGTVTWLTSPGREVSECVLRHGHGGDHRDEGGYPWNNARWID